MKTVTATEASRNFTDLLDTIERGETIIVTRGHRPIAEIRPICRHTGADLRAALDGIEPPDDRYEENIHSALGLLTTSSHRPIARVTATGRGMDQLGRYDLIELTYTLTSSACSDGMSNCTPTWRRGFSILFGQIRPQRIL
jgi:antitoxin (DNA-binding transcriptional repressor) of toxin-antitoxin stability system